MRAKSLIVLLITSIYCIQAQQNEVLFTNQFFSNKTYLTTMKVNTTANFKIMGDEDFNQKLSEAGKEKTFSITGVYEMEMNTKTLSQNEKGIPFEIEYINLQSKNNINGKEEIKQNPIVGTKIHGYYFDKTKVKVDSVVGKNLDEAFKNSITATIESVTQNVKYPDKPMKIEDSFVQEIPIAIPIPGLGNINATIMTTYTLKKTTGNNAFFNTIQNIKMDSDFEKFRIVINGFGHGTLTYDILNKITALNSSRLSMKMDISSKGFNITSDSIADVVYEIRLK